MNQTADAPDQPLVLIADDDGTHRRVLRSVLEKAGFRVETAEDGRQALEIFDDKAPDVVLLDIEMPELDGFSVCEEIRARESLRETPIFIITGREDDDAVERAYSLGATDFLNKPIGLAVLPHRIRYVLRTSTSLNDLRGLIRAIPDLIFVVNEHGEVQEGLSRGDATHTQQIQALSTASKVNFYPCENDDAARACIKRALETGKTQVHEHTLEALDIHLETRFVNRDQNTVLAIVRDITERKKSEDRIFNLAYFDELTALPNRQLFGQSLERTIEKAQRDDEKFAVLFVDLDRFKRINDTLGHSVGDELLKDVARRLEKCIRATDSISRIEAFNEEVQLARLGGDEFVIQLYGIESEETVATIATRIINVLTPPFSCEGHQFVVTPSIGVALYPQDGTSAEELLMNADSAMYRAKFAGRNNFQFFSETMRSKSLHRLDLENEIRKALDNNQFQLHYQPKADAESWTLVGAEALLRWNHPERGFIQPAEFIPVAEETGLIVPIGQWVLREACKQAKIWTNAPFGNIAVAVNISSHQFQSDSLIDDVLGAALSAGIDPKSLELEITESVLLQDVENTLVALNTLKRAGISLSVDDFGTGYSSLSYLKRFPIDTLKIDRSFVKDIHLDQDDAAICAAILAMARQLGLNVVAEGVETKEQLEFLRHHGCNQIQGFLCSKPLSAQQFDVLLREIAKTAANEPDANPASA
ncbi:MAG: EAL domain-containing protein [Woeseiaceae bacterium]|nr:EAL domain-containing protein [Woeseiaceae bacterium]